MSEVNPEENLRAGNFLILAVLGAASYGLYKLAIHLFVLVKVHFIIGAAILSGFILGVLFLLLAIFKVWESTGERERLNKRLTAKRENSLLIGKEEESHAPVYLPFSARRAHTQIVGTTGSGKTESVILPFAMDDIKNGRGVFLLDGKPETETLLQISGFAKLCGRGYDFKVFSLKDPEISSTFNPLVGGSVQEIADRVFEAFDFEDSYYRGIQLEVFTKILEIFRSVDVVPTFKAVLECINKPSPRLMKMAVAGGDLELKEWVDTFIQLKLEDREKRTSGMVSQFTPFASGDFAGLFNQADPEIDLVRAMAKNEIIYFQLPALSFPKFGASVGKLILSSLAYGASQRHTNNKNTNYFMVYLDDFSEFIYNGFTTILNKTRSAKVAVTFAHQSMGDLEALGLHVKNSVITNSNLKILMKCIDPVSTEYCAKLIGTDTGEKLTHRAKTSIFGQVITGDTSLREVESFTAHPNIFKSEMGAGHAYVIIPHEFGAKTVRLRFHKLNKVPGADLPRRPQPVAQGVSEKFCSIGESAIGNMATDKGRRSA